MRGMRACSASVHAQPARPFLAKLASVEVSAVRQCACLARLCKARGMNPVASQSIAANNRPPHCVAALLLALPNV